MANIHEQVTNGLTTLSQFARNCRILISEPLARQAFQSQIRETRNFSNADSKSNFRPELLIAQTIRERDEIFRKNPDEIMKALATKDPDLLNSEEEKKDGRAFHYLVKDGVTYIEPSLLMNKILHFLDHEWRFRNRDVVNETLLDQGPSNAMVTTETVTQHIYDLFHAVGDFYTQSSAAQKYLHPLFFNFLPFIHELEEVPFGDVTLDAKDKNNGGPKVNHDMLEYAEHVKNIKPIIEGIIGEDVPQRELAVIWLAHTIALFDHFSLIDSSHPLALDIIVGRFFDTYIGNERWLADKKERKFVVSGRKEAERMIKSYDKRSPTYQKIDSEGSSDQYEVTVPAVIKLDKDTAQSQAMKLQKRFQVYFNKMLELKIPQELFHDLVEIYGEQLREFAKLGVEIALESPQGKVLLEFPS